MYVRTFMYVCMFIYVIMLGPHHPMVINFISTYVYVYVYMYKNGHNFSNIRYLNTIDRGYLYKRCFYEVFCVK